MKSRDSVPVVMIDPVVKMPGKSEDDHVANVHCIAVLFANIDSVPYQVLFVQYIHFVLLYAWILLINA